MRIAIVNHLATATEILREVLVENGDLELAWIADSGEEAIAQCKRDRPDLVLMELEMPFMDGVEATRRIMQEAKCPILVVTATVEGSASKVFDAMGCGALDAVNTPLRGEPKPLLRKIASIRRLIGVAPAETLASPRREVPPLIAIGSSTGGPAALAELLPRLPADLDASVIVVQHVDAQFAPGMANWLDSQSSLEVKMVETGAVPSRGTVHLAGSDDHLVITAERTFAYTPDPKDLPYRPSVDVFFESLAVHWPVWSIGLVLTGMGRDGARGLLALRRLGWHTIAQDEASSLIFGMPKACAEMGAAKIVLPLSDIASNLQMELQRQTRGKR